MILRNFVSLRAFTVYMENSLRFEISLRSSLPTWDLHRSEFLFAWIHVNANNEVTLHRSETTPKWNRKLVWDFIGSHVNVLLVSFCKFVELFKLKLKLYLRVTQISNQAATGTVESNRHSIVYLIDILYT